MAEDRRRIDRYAEQHDRDLQQKVAAETNAGQPASVRCPQGAHQRAQENGQDQRLQSGVAEQPPFAGFQGIGGGGDHGAQGQARQDGQQKGWNAFHGGVLSPATIRFHN